MPFPLTETVKCIVSHGLPLLIHVQEYRIIDFLVIARTMPGLGFAENTLIFKNKGPKVVLWKIHTCMDFPA